ncbi:MAG: hypothetical protein IT440_04155 [Phycisphaeraceae bacterium]|nr:hypothetical protein [Phycisphaeraceae bacterium]
MNVDPTPALSPIKLPLSVLGALAIAGGLIAATLAIWNRPDPWAGFWPATLVSLVAGLLSTLPLLLGSRLGLMGAVGGYFTAGAVRAVVSIGGCLALVAWWRAPLAPTLLIMCAYYAAVLAAETILMAKTLWNLPGTTRTS